MLWFMGLQSQTRLSDCTESSLKKKKKNIYIYIYNIICIYACMYTK